MKKLFNFRLLVLLGVLMMSISQVWADGTNHTINYPYFYFNNAGDWSKCMVLYGRKWDGEWGGKTPGHWTVGQNLVPVSGTQLFYAEISSGYWGNSYNEVAVLEAEQDASHWNGEQNHIEGRWTSVSNKSSVVWNHDLLYHYTYLFDDNSITDVSTNTSTGYLALNHAQTVEKWTSTDNGSSYTKNSSINSGEVTINAYKMTGNGTADNDGNSDTFDAASEVSASVDAAYTGTVRLSATSYDGYTFVGWYDTSNGLISADNPYTYDAPNSTKTIRARFKNESTHNVTISYMCSSSSIKNSDTENGVGTETPREISAPDIDQYDFVNWTYGNGITIVSGTTTDATISINSVDGSDLSYTLTANYKRLTRLYFSNPNSWSNVYAYVWDGSGNNGWTANKINSYTKTINCRTCYYFEYDASSRAWQNIIFHDGTSPGTVGSTKTADLTISGNEDKYYNGSAWIGDFTAHTITVTTEDANHGSVSGGGSTRVDGGDGCIASVTATPAAGYRFKEWVVQSGTATVTSSTSATSTVTASTDAVVKATFTTDGFVYLDKSAISGSWGGTPYVYFYSAAYWDKDGKGSGSHTGGGITVYGPYAMTRIGDSQIWYYDYSTTPGTGTTKNYIAFNDHNQSDYNNFVACLAIYRGDFYQKQNMFVVKDYKYYYNTSAKEGQAVYYNDGYWRKFNDTDPGYVIKTYNGFDQSSSLTGTYRLSSDEPGASNCYVDIALNSGTNYFKVVGCDTTTINGIGYTGTYYRDGSNGTMNTDNCTNWLLTDGNGSNTGVLATASADYKFTLTLGAGSLFISVDFPLAVGDFRLMYDGKMRTTYETKKQHPSNYIRKLKQPTIADDTTRVDTISFFVDPASGALVPSLKIQYCNNIDGYNIYWRDTLSAVNLSGITKAGTYNFIVTQTNNKSGTHTISCVLDEEYSGDYYIRTNSATGGWKSYKVTADNLMTYSDYAKKHSGYDYYFCKWVNTDANVKFTIANDYSECITDTVDNDDIVNRDNPNNGKLQYQASVRFMYNSATNVITRAYLNGSSDGIANYLYIKAKDGTGAGNNDSIKNADGSAITSVDGYKEVKFEDNNNWVYVKNIQAREGTHVRLISDYYDNSSHHYQYLKGSNAGTWTAASTSQIIGGTSGAYQTLRMVYDFKTNQLLAAWMPSGSEIDEELPIYADVMIIREAQGDAKQITFGEFGAPSKYGSLTDIETVYGVMQFNKYTLNNQSKEEGHAALTEEDSLSVYARDLYWISFPFDVNLNDVFGFGTYGTHWIIEYYDGKGRAKNGFWADSKPNWKFVTPDMRDTFKLKAFEGYILALDLDEMNLGSNTGVWANNVTDIYLYFPSSASVGSIVRQDTTVTIDQTGYRCTIGPRFEGGDDRRIKDSYWHCIGVPSYANASHAVSESDVPGSLGGADYWSPDETLYFYEWDPSDNSLDIQTTTPQSFHATHSYMVQYAGTTLSWSAVSIAPASVAARLKEVQDMEYKLVLQSSSRVEDQTFIRLTDDVNVTTGFEFNYDLCKEMNKNRANIYTLISTTIDSVPSITEAAANVQPHPLATTIVPVGVKIATAGEYTFTMPEGTNGGDVWLLDNQTNSHTNLGLMDYTVNLTAGTIDGRFSLEFGPIQDAPTGIDEMSTVNSQLSTDSVRKVFVGGRLYIIRDGKAYDATGKRVE